MPGYAITALDVNNQAGNVVRNLWDALRAAGDFKAWLDDANHTDTFLTTTLGIPAGDVTTLRVALTDLDKLRQIAHAAATQGTTNDFFFNAKLLTGVGWSG